MWKIQVIESSDQNLKFRIVEEGIQITNQRFFDALSSNRDFRTFYNGLLAEMPFRAFFWENKPVTTYNIDEPYECSIVRSVFLAGKEAEKHAFQLYFDPDREVVVFPNLGRDAQLIVPCPRKDTVDYPHLAVFVKQADQKQIDAFWKKTGEEMLLAISDEPRWLSTSGLGVFWLHVRIDTYPKYYQTTEYKEV